MFHYIHNFKVKTQHIIGVCCYLTGSVINSKCNINISGERKKLLPFLVGIGLLPMSVIAFPIIVIDDLFQLCIVDKCIDNILDKYIIEYNRYQQYRIPSKGKY